MVWRIFQILLGAEDWLIQAPDYLVKTKPGAISQVNLKSAPVPRMQTAVG